VSWSQAALVLCIVMGIFCCLICIFGCLMRPKRYLPKPTQDWKRNGTECAGRYE
jgi:hypothetical protein